MGAVGMVARCEQLPFAPVPDRECEHAVEFLYAENVPFFVGVNDYLCVRVGVESGAGFWECFSELSKIVCFAVVDNSD